ncbi:hypothetical protein BDZ45DRAFT_751177 [Acephala macrosclerotiorum]|nr:hypothetical protein BDZ45DRAFT_751177 [Acephala macrosclerotiorum]
MATVLAMAAVGPAIAAALPAPVQNPAATATPANSFTLFNRLPTKLQLKIFGLVFGGPRIIKLRLRPDRHGLLGVVGNYPLAFGTLNGCPAMARFNFQLDTLYFDESFHEDHHIFSLITQMDRPDLLVQNLAAHTLAL